MIKLTVNGRNGKGKAREELVGALAAEAGEFASDFRSFLPSLGAGEV